MSRDKSGVAVIGWGAMARSLAASLADGPTGIRIAAALVRKPPLSPVAPEVETLTSIEALIGWGPSLVVECAGHGAVREAVPRLLAAGIPVIVVSLGALADAVLRDRLERVSTPKGRLSLVAGAVGGLDILRSARLAGLDSVVYRGTKPPAAWRGTPAETAFDLAALRQSTVIFEGSAADASRLYPKNANVTAAVALAGIGFDRTVVTLVADPDATGNAHHIEAEGAFGRVSVSLENRPLPDNPRTSWLAALSVEQAVIRHFQTIEF